MATEARNPPDSIDDHLAHDALPIVRRVVAQRLGAGPDQDDVCAQVLLELTRYLRGGAASELDGAALAGYVAVAAHHGCDRYLRLKHPLRWRLRNRIRYVLQHDRRFALWKGDQGHWWCGRDGWQAAAPGALPAADHIGASVGSRIVPMLLQLFQASGGPLRLSEIAEFAASLWRIPAQAQEDLNAAGEVVDRTPRVDEAMEQRQRATRTWQEVQALPVRQRQALLLNLKHDAIVLLIVTGIASLRTIADSLDMPVEVLADLWKDLPLSDNEIAARQGCTRQQVINLRMAARKRLANRLAGWR